MNFYNLAREYTVTTGTADVVLSGAIPGCNTWDDAGVPNAWTGSYTIITYDLSTHRPIGTECGSGTYTTATKTLARTTVESSTDSDAKISLTGLSEVFITPLASDFAANAAPSFAVYLSSSTNSVTNTNSQNPLNITTEVHDADGIFTLASNILTCNLDGWYEFTIQIDVSDGTNFGNGYFDVWLQTGASTTPTYMPYLFVMTAADSAAFESNYTFGGPVALTATDTVQFGGENFTGGTVDFQIMSILIKRLGGL